MASIIKCGFPDCDWAYKNSRLVSDETDYLMKRLFLHYIEKHEVPTPEWDFYVEEDDEKVGGNNGS